MIILDKITSISADRLRCRITRNGVVSELTVQFTQHDSGIQSLDFEGMPDKEYLEFVKCDELRAFMKILWQYFRGELTAELPIEIISDWYWAVQKPVP